MRIIAEWTTLKLLAKLKASCKSWKTHKTCSVSETRTFFVASQKGRSDDPKTSRRNSRLESAPITADLATLSRARVGWGFAKVGAVAFWKTVESASGALTTVFGRVWSKFARGSHSVDWADGWCQIQGKRRLCVISKTANQAANGTTLKDEKRGVGCQRI